MDFEFETKRTALANEFAEAGAELLAYQPLVSTAVAAIPDTQPQKYAVAGTLNGILSMAGKMMGEDGAEQPTGDLTDEQIKTIHESIDWGVMGSGITFARAIEHAAIAAHLARQPKAEPFAYFRDDSGFVLASSWCGEKPPRGAMALYKAAPAGAQNAEAIRNQWISVKDQLPKTEHECTSRDLMVSNSFYVRGVAADGGEGFGMADYQEDGKWHCYGGDYDFMHVVEVTHYLPIRTADLQTGSANTQEGDASATKGSEA